MNKREMIERALYPLIINAKARKSWWRRGIAQGLARFLGGALAKQVIAIRCEVEHISKPGEEVVGYTGIYGFPTGLPGIHGTPGEGLAIIIPLEVKDGNKNNF